MALDKNSNGFTIGFAVILVAVVGALLAAVSVGLKDLQDKNQEDKKRMDILGAIKPSEDITRDNAADLYNKYVKEAIIISGKDKGKMEAFKVDVKKEFRDKTLASDDRNYPLYICEKEGENFYVIPMVGKGLWGPIWGFVALKQDYTTIYGAKFDHKGETPGLGAEIKTAKFEAQYEGEQITVNGEYAELVIVKDGSGRGINSKIDGITGGTITSVGVEEMTTRTLAIYADYFKSLK